MQFSIQIGEEPELHEFKPLAGLPFLSV